MRGLATFAHLAALWLFVAVTGLVLALLPKIKPGSQEDYDMALD